MALEPKQLEKVLRRIADADLDQMHEIQSLLNARYRTLRVGARRAALGTFKVGDEATLINIKPKYMEGTMVIVDALEGTRFRVRPTGYIDPRGINRFGKSFKVPANCLKRMV